MSFCSLQGKRALVTGGTRGIGKATAKALAEAGAEVVISGTNAEELAKTAGDIGGTFIVANLADDAGVQSLIEQVGAVDILVNNAGITRDGLFMRQSDQQWDEVLNVNLNAAAKLTRALITPMSKKKWGRVISITSVVSHMGNSGQSNYIAAKAAMTGLTRALAKEMGRRGITFNAIAPGFIETGMTQKLPEAVVDEYKKQIPLQRFGTPEEIAAVVRFLASDEAGYITGTTVHVNGGMYV